MLRINRGPVAKPQKVVVYGPEGIGKTTFAAQFPDPLFVDTEGGTETYDVARTDATHLRAGAGIPLARLAQAALGYGLAGLEFAHGIPGSLGGAVSMNAGAYGGEMKDIVVSTRYLDHDLNLCEAVGAAHDFGYRHSVFSDTDCVVLGSTLALTPGDPAEIRARMLDLSERRASRSSCRARAARSSAPRGAMPPRSSTRPASRAMPSAARR